VQVRPIVLIDLGPTLIVLKGEAIWIAPVLGVVWFLLLSHASRSWVLFYAGRACVSGFPEFLFLQENWQIDEPKPPEFQGFYASCRS
jgi:hypothetical protein